MDTGNLIQYWLPIVVFGFVFAGVLLELTEKSLITAIGAFVLILLHSIDQHDALAMIDFDTLTLLFGMMIVVEVAAKARLFEWLSIVILQLTKGRPLLIFVLFMANTLVLSSFLNNVTTILIMLPLTIEIAKGIGLNMRPFVIGEIIAANIGGLLTLIGDPVNTIVGSAADLGMTSFTINLGIPVVIIACATTFFLWATDKTSFADIRTDFVKVLHNLLVLKNVENRFKSLPFDVTLLRIAIACLALTIGAFIAAEPLGLSPGLIAMIGATGAMIATHHRVPFSTIIGGIEWQTLLFFGGLFVVVGAVEQTGVLEQMANGIVAITAHPASLLAIILVSTAVISAIVDNVPFVTLMIPIIRSIQEQSIFPDGSVLWWALCLGAVIGGLASPYGSSANIVAVGTARKAGYKLSNGTYMLYSVPISIGGILVSYAYLAIAYLRP